MELLKSNMNTYQMNSGTHERIPGLTSFFNSSYSIIIEYPIFYPERSDFIIVLSGFKARENRPVIPKFNEGVKYRDKYTNPENI